MKRLLIPLVLLLIVLLIAAWTIPVKQAFTFTETRTEHPRFAYKLLADDDEFQIRYVHSIFLTDVIETYRVLPDRSIRFLTMRYEDVGIGLPAHAEEGESLTVTDEGIYTLTYEDKVIDSFVLYIGDVDAQLAFRYSGEETDLKRFLERGHSYEFRVKKLTLIELLKGARLNGKEY
ncbi:hypothetical protein NCCP2716_00970 [Sporosarcina sp. NCCP-2716]|uniref:DUF1850 domain-containing protein n=1 Tax=Sporosarcina sp. NCCP-2716 TaxID=2943679 RepID=UPI0020422EE6|nr:DUF1850 domain-containing protein [Sporosarcina sp. NCCP-2716]GKV67599.1 hypothetical protein NCCP2716_00970 [Sporosarcina sp. NCCP-2716]